jgi:hypothetical protein
MGAAVGSRRDRESGARPAGRWSESTWTGEGLRREVFFFRSRGVELYGSLYAATEIVRPFGVVLCNSWGVEADRCDPLQRSIALEMARAGGAGLVFHYPGYGDSYGDLAGLGLEDLSGAAADAVAEASRRRPGLAWILAGVVLGASVACLARRQADVETLLLVQPALRPGAYFQKLATSRRPIAPGPSPREMMEVGSAPGMAYGYPIPGRIAENAEAADDAVTAALQAFQGEGAVIRHEKPSDSEPVPDRFRQCDVPGTWRFGSQNNPKLARATIEWLDRRTQGVTVGP